MSDVLMRQLERRWRETGAVEDEVAFLVERVRVGALSAYRVQLAADCGHLAASAALDALGIAPLTARPSFQSWVHFDDGIGDRVERLRASLAAALEASRVAKEISTESERTIGLKPADPTGRERLLTDLGRWIHQLADGELGLVPPRRRLSANSPADQAAKMLLEAASAVRQSPIGNAPECAIAAALELAAEVLGEECVKRVVAATALR